MSLGACLPSSHLSHTPNLVHLSKIRLIIRHTCVHTYEVTTTLHSSTERTKVSNYVCRSSWLCDASYCKPLGPATRASSWSLRCGCSCCHCATLWSNIRGSQALLSKV